jgi:hypothetical protein
MALPATAFALDDPLAGTWQGGQGSEVWNVTFSNGATSWSGTYDSCTGTYSSDGSFHLRCVPTTGQGSAPHVDDGSCTATATTLHCDYVWTLDVGGSGMGDFNGTRVVAGGGTGGTGGGGSGAGGTGGATGTGGSPAAVPALSRGASTGVFYVLLALGVACLRRRPSRRLTS